MNSITTCLTPSLHTRHVELLTDVRSNNSDYLGNPSRILADEEGCERAFMLALRLERLHFIEPQGRELVGRLSRLQAHTNHHAVARWVMTSMPWLCARSPQPIEVIGLITSFAEAMRCIARNGSI